MSDLDPKPHCMYTRITRPKKIKMKKKKYQQASSQPKLVPIDMYSVRGTCLLISSYSTEYSTTVVN